MGELIGLIVANGVIAVTLVLLSAIGTVYHIRANKGDLHIRSEGQLQVSDGKHQTVTVQVSLVSDSSAADASHQWMQDIKTLPFNVSLRLVASVISVLHCVLEICEATGVTLPLAFYLVSDNLQLIAGLLVRVFLLNRSLSFVISSIKRQLWLRVGMLVLLALYVKSAVLVNSMFELDDDDLEYPPAILYMLAIENIAFDLAMTAFTAYWLMLASRGLAKPDRKNQDKAVRLLLRINMYNVACMAVCLILAEMAFQDHAAQLIVVINGALFSCSMWIAEVYFYFNLRFGLRRSSSTSGSKKLSASVSDRGSATIRSPLGHSPSTVAL